MTSFGITNLLPRHFAANNLKLKFDTGKVQRAALSIGFICKTFFIFYFYCLFHFRLTILLSLFRYLQLHLPYFPTISE